MSAIQLPTDKERGEIEARLKEHNRKVIAEALSPDNRWFTGEKVKHNPTIFELITHWQAFAGEEKNFHG